MRFKQFHRAKNCKKWGSFEIFQDTIYIKESIIVMSFCPFCCDTPELSKIVLPKVEKLTMSFNFDNVLFCILHITFEQ